MQHTLILPDGRRISSGSAGPAIRSVTLTQSVNTETYLAPGAVCAAGLELTLFDEEGLSLAAGDRVTLEGVGVFLLEAPQRRGLILTLRGWDCVTCLDRDLTDWLNTLEGWPYTLETFASMVCAACGLTLETGTLPNGTMAIPQFRGTGVTGRQLMHWVGEAACRFCRAQGEDTLALAWYTPTATVLGPSGSSFYYRGSLTLQDPVPVPDSLCIRRSPSDVGVASSDGENPLYITGNYLLTEADAQVCQTILEELSSLAYTPCSFETPVSVAPGDILQVGGVTALAMTVEKTGSRYRVSAVAGAAGESRTTSAYQALSGRLLEAELGLDGVSARLSQVQGTAESTASLALSLEAIETRVAATEQTAAGLQAQSTALLQRAEGLELAVIGTTQALDEKADAQTLEEWGEYFRLDAEGLTISNDATGMGIGVNQERVIFTGGSDPTTVIEPSRMTTTQLEVGSRLDLGSFAFLPRSNGNLSFRCTQS